MYRIEFVWSNLFLQLKVSHKLVDFDVTNRYGMLDYYVCIYNL